MKQHMKSLLAATLLVIGNLCCCSSCTATSVTAESPSDINDGKTAVTTIAYTPSDKEIINPERGMFTHHEFYSDKNNELTLEQLQQLRNEGMSLIFTVYVMRDFRNKDISTPYLNKIRRNLRAIRHSGMKAIVRFCYSYSEKDPGMPHGTSPDAISNS